MTPSRHLLPCSWLRRLLTAVCLLMVAAALVMTPPAGPVSAAEALAADALAADSPVTTSARTPPLFDRNLMLFGCMGGLVVGAVSTVLPPVAGWAVAGVWMGGLGTMILRTGLGCAYGGLAGAVASAARRFYLWMLIQWHGGGDNPAAPPLVIEGRSDS